MAVKQPTRIIFPTGGLRRDLGYQSQPPYTTPDCRNVRPVDSEERRTRGGSRDMLSRHFPEELGNWGELDTAVKDNGTSTITAVSSVFLSTDVALDITFLTSGNSYTISSFTSDNVVVVAGDASAETGFFSIGRSAGLPIRLLDQVTVIPTDSSKSFKDRLYDPSPGGGLYSYLEGNWDAATWTANWAADSDDALPIYVGGSAVGSYNSAGTVDHRAALISYLPKFDSDQQYRWAVRMANISPGCKFRIFILVTDNGAGNGSKWYDAGGIMLEVSKASSGSNYTWKLFAYDENEAYATDGSNDIDGTGDYTETGPVLYRLYNPSMLIIDYNPSTKALSVLINGNIVVDDITVTGINGVTGTGIGFETYVDDAGDTSGVYVSTAYSCELSYLSESYGEQNRSYLVAGAGGKIYADSEIGRLSVQSGAGIARDHGVMAVEYLQQLYVADYGILHRGTNGDSGAGVATFTSVGAKFLGTDGVNPAVIANDCALVVHSVDGDSSDSAVGAYGIASVDSDTQVTLDTDPGTITNVVYTIERCPKRYDPPTGTMSRWLYGGQTHPIGRPCICVYSDRIILAGPDHEWFASRQGVPDGSSLFDTSGSDFTKAFIGTNIEGGRISSPIRALVPQDDFLYFLCTYQVWVLRGDPGYGSSELRSLSHSVGCVDKQAWCFGPESEVYFLSQSGIFVLLPDPTATPKPLSQDKLPMALRRIDPAQREVRLAYDSDRRGVVINLFDLLGNDDRSYFFYIPTGSFWRDDFQYDHAPASMLSFEPDDGQVLSVLLGGRDGLVRKFDQTVSDDDGSTVTSYIWLGPFGHGGAKLFLDSLQSKLDSESGDITWGIYAGKTAEKAMLSTAKRTGTFSAGLSNNKVLRIGGESVFIKITSTTQWAMEEFLARMHYGGKIRK